MSTAAAAAAAAIVAEPVVELTKEALDIFQEDADTIISSQMSSDELVSNEDITHTHSIILEGREELEEMGELDEDYEEKVVSTRPVITLDLFGILRKGAINLVLPFINGIMLGFGEIFAHEIGFKYGFFGARVYPARRQAQAQAQRQSSKFI